MNRISKLVLPIILISFLFVTGCNQKQESSATGRIFVTIGTGGVTGVYYPTGGAISRIINQKFDTYRIKATVESTSGSVYNINAVLSGDLQFGIAQSDSQYQAINGQKDWQEKVPHKDMLSVF